MHRGASRTAFKFEALIHTDCGLVFIWMPYAGERWCGGCCLTGFHAQQGSTSASNTGTYFVGGNYPGKLVIPHFEIAAIQRANEEHMGCYTNKTSYRKVFSSCVYTLVLPAIPLFQPLFNSAESCRCMLAEWLHLHMVLEAA